MEFHPLLHTEQINLLFFMYFFFENNFFHLLKLPLLEMSSIACFHSHWIKGLYLFPHKECKGHAFPISGETVIVYGEWLLLPSPAQSLVQSCVTLMYRFFFNLTCMGVFVLDFLWWTMKQTTVFSTPKL